MQTEVPWDISAATFKMPLQQMAAGRVHGSLPACPGLASGSDC